MQFKSSFKMCVCIYDCPNIKILCEIYLLLASRPLVRWPTLAIIVPYSKKKFNQSKRSRFCIQNVISFRVDSYQLCLLSCYTFGLRHAINFESSTFALSLAKESEWNTQSERIDGRKKNWMYVRHGIEDKVAVCKFTHKHTDSFTPAHRIFFGALANPLIVWELTICIHWTILHRLFKV